MPEFELVHPAMALTGEAPIWDGYHEKLWWIDIQGQRLLGYAPRSGKKEAHALPLLPGLIALGRERTLIIGLEDGLWSFDPVNASLKKRVDIAADRSGIRLNDGKVDRQGRLWFGSMGIAADEAAGCLYCLDTDGSIHRVLESISIPNAIAVSPLGDTLYFTDSPTKTLYAYGLDAKRVALGERRVLKEYGTNEAPDGACVDAEGGIWVAVIGGARIERITPDGSVSDVLELPVSRPTMPMFGGHDLKTIFVTSQRRFLSAEQLVQEPLAGHLLSLQQEKYTGLPSPESVG